MKKVEKVKRLAASPLTEPDDDGDAVDDPE
jgi:hypothetical protein